MTHSLTFSLSLTLPPLSLSLCLSISLTHSPSLTPPLPERQRNKLIAQEAKEQENLAMRTMMGRYGQEDNAKAAKKQVSGSVGEVGG